MAQPEFNMGDVSGATLPCIPEPEKTTRGLEDFSFVLFIYFNRHFNLLH